MLQILKPILLALLTLTFILITPVVASNGLQLEQQGASYYNVGNFAEAAKTWQKAADAYENDTEAKNRNLINKAKALYSLGLYPEACNQITKIYTSNLTCDKLISNQILNIQIQQNRNQVASLHLLGDIIQRLGEFDLSKQILQKSLEVSQKYPEYQSAIYISLGNLERNIANKSRDSLEYRKVVDAIKDKDIDFTLSLYDQALNNYNLARKQAPILTQTQAELNEFSLLVENKRWWTEQILKIQDDPWQELQEKIDTKLATRQQNIEFSLNSLPQNRESIYAFINFSNSLMKLNSINLKLNKKSFPPQKIAQILSTAIKQAHNIGDKQAEALGLTNLARLYELQVTNKLTKQEILNLTTAQKLTEQALNLSNDINADKRQILYSQRHQLGRIERARGNIKAALSSYAEAWNILQSLRADLVTSADNQFSFRQNVEPIYREFIDLLLQADRDKIDLSKLVLQTEGKAPRNNLDTARLVMQSLQLAELDNFFQEPCSPPVNKPVQIDNIDKNAVVIYPIILENSLEVILYQAGQTTSLSVAVNHNEVKKTIEDLASLIYNNTQVEPDSALLINRGKLDDSEREKLKRNKQKLLEHSQQLYNWLIKPLEETNQLNTQSNKTIVFVLDRAFQKIPITALYDNINNKYLVEKYNIVLNLGQELIKPKLLQTSNIKVLATGVSEEQVVGEEIFPALKGVEKELKSFEELKVNTKIIPTEGFNKKNLLIQIKASPDIVHLATHGVFSSNRERTFLVTGDNNKITVDDFQDLLNPQGRERNKNIELLVLSACQTASGDERAALGMAGVVIRSQASSAIASLWPVSDAATVQLMKEFYQNLITKKMPRAEALRNAQITLLKDENYNHPFYWAPFILVGNWL
jgi:CHAT domain-containing protein